MRILVINNLEAGLQDASIFSFIRHFSKDGDEIVVRNSASITDCRAHLFDAEKFDAVVCAGGDGTVANVAYAMKYTRIPLLPYPAGTANLLALNLYAPTDNPALATLTHRLNTLSFDLGEIELNDTEKIGFSIMAGAGYDADIMKGAAPDKKLLGPLSYAKSAVTQLSPTHSKITLNIDGETITTEGIGILVVNFSRIQFDISVIHECKPRDGMLDVVVLHTKGAVGLIPALFSAMLDRSGDFPGRTSAMKVYSGHEVEVICDPPLPIQYDGELAHAKTPFKARTLPLATNLIVSDEAMKKYSDI